MQIEEAIRGKLTGDPAVGALLGQRVYPGQGPQGAPLPLCVYTQASQQYLMALARRLATNRYLMHLDIWAEDYSACKACYHAVRDCLAGFRGALGAGQVEVMGVFDEGGDDDAEPPIHSEENGLWRAGLDLSIWYQGGG